MHRSVEGIGRRRRHPSVIPGCRHWRWLPSGRWDPLRRGTGDGSPRALSRRARKRDSRGARGHRPSRWPGRWHPARAAGARRAHRGRCRRARAGVGRATHLRGVSLAGAGRRPGAGVVPCLKGTGGGPDRTANPAIARGSGSAVGIGGASPLNADAAYGRSVGRH